MRVLLFTTLAMFAFAANSLLCRLALANASIDGASFTFFRLLSGAVMLLLVITWRQEKFNWRQIDGISALALFLYAACFSFSYISLSAATGALILFGLVQFTMIGYGLYSGERPSALAWLGMLMAVAGLVYLLSPGIAAPPAGAAALMMVSGIAWGVYSLRGRRVANPELSTAHNFIGASVLGLILFAIQIPHWHFSAMGVLLAVLSGMVASALGYVIWYSVLPALKASTAANVQLSVPVIAALVAVLMLGEPLTLRIIIASVVILGGIVLVIRAKQQA